MESLGVTCDGRARAVSLRTISGTFSLSPRNTSNFLRTRNDAGRRVASPCITSDAKGALKCTLRAGQVDRLTPHKLIAREYERVSLTAYRRFPLRPINEGRRHSKDFLSNLSADKSFLIKYSPYIYSFLQDRFFPSLNLIRSNPNFNLNVLLTQARIDKILWILFYNDNIWKHLIGEKIDLSIKKG